MTNRKRHHANKGRDEELRKFTRDKMGKTIPEAIKELGHYKKLIRKYEVHKLLNE